MHMRGSKFQKLNFQLEYKITKRILHKWIFFVTKDRKKIYRVKKASKLMLSLVVCKSIFKGDPTGLKRTFELKSKKWNKPGVVKSGVK